MGGSEAAMRLGGNPERAPVAGPWPDATGFMSENRLGFLLSLGMALVIVFIYGFGSVEITEYGLNYSLVTRRVEPATYPSGRYWIGPLNHFVKFPAILTTIQFSDSSMQTDLQERGDETLQSRTRDGLNVAIELSFQYQIIAEKVHELYTSLGAYPDFHNVFVRLAIDRLTEAATAYSATEFFTQRTVIGHAMERQLKKDFKDRLFSNVYSFQLRTVSLPDEFESAIQETEVMRQDLQVAEAEQNATRVALETQLIQAKKRTKVKANKGEAEAAAVLLANKADIEQYVAMQHKSADSYSDVLQELGSNEGSMLDYMQARVLRDHPADKTVVGLSLGALAMKGGG